SSSAHSAPSSPSCTAWPSSTAPSVPTGHARHPSTPPARRAHRLRLRFPDVESPHRARAGTSTATVVRGVHGVRGVSARRRGGVRGMSLGDEHQATEGYGGTGQTRTRLPEGEGGGPYGGARRTGRSSSRSLVTVVGVVVLLIAAIAFANRGGDGSASGTPETDSPKAAATAPSGEKPVDTKTGGIPSGFAHDRQGAESAAANYAVALGSDEMFKKPQRSAILRSIIVPDRVADFEATLDKAYSPEFNKNVGLNEDGTTPKSFTFVSRTSPMGTKVTESSANSATVEVWCSGLLGLAGESSTNPV